MATTSLPHTPESFDKVPKSAEKSTSWQSVAARRRAEILTKIPEEYIVDRSLLNAINHSDLLRQSNILSDREISIVNSTATELLKWIHSLMYTAVEVTRAFCKSAAIAHQATNCLAWVLFDEALAAATELDEYMKVHGKPKGPLHGLPISVKEHIFFVGTPATSGFIAWADEYAEEDALIVRVFRDAGAVFHVKTTNPQALMALETESNLYGTTTNPYNVNLTPGGSSGGESALIAMKGSLLGIGTDIGGSIRVPAAFCGLFGLKPSVARLPHGGLSGLHAGMENIIGAVGPLATSIADLRLFCKV
jgi:amidase